MARCVVAAGGCGTIASCTARLHCVWPGSDEAWATRTTRPPYAGDKDSKVYRVADCIVTAPIPDVLRLHLPSASERMLDACCPHGGIHRLEIRRSHNVLAVSGKDVRGLGWDLRRWIAVLVGVAVNLSAPITAGTASKPRIAETKHRGIRGRSWRTCRGIRRILLVPLRGEPVRLIPS